MFDREEIEAITGGKVVGNGKIAGISTDTRALKPGELFIPLKGKNFDGRKFLKKAPLALDVKDGLAALHKLAAFHRNKFKIPFIGVTGSVGKTTVKDMLSSILSQEMEVLKNEENLNNEIGVPLTLLKLNNKHKAAVIEMAMQGLGEIEELARIVKPHVAVITNIGEAHLKFLKTKRNIAKAKAEIFTYLKKGDFAVINQDDEFFEHLKQRVKGKGKRVMTFGILEKAEVTPKDLMGIKLPVPGEHMIMDALAAIAAAKVLGVKNPSIKKGLEEFCPSSKRMQVILKENGTKILNDTYNANPQSMAAALKVLADLPGRKIAVLGDMLELGKISKAAHRRIIRLARDLKIDRVYTLGKLWPKVTTPEKNRKTLLKKLKKFIRPRDIILVKGSRGLKMENIVAAVVEWQTCLPAGRHVR
ncbi:UDP-N-acetylmuramoyl-tripeptide--D-alanyl-D-alanine ligase [Candidatus Saganbacteria bacterium]|nr:UDP-N-acetylmuramoyl-tripeptide--D-alanyl-D-alanine ligase [Candidatus Saganbacteria bacterium]